MSSSACNTRDKSLVVIYKSNPVGVALINRQYRNGSVEYLVYLFPGMKRGRPSRNGMYRCREDHSRREGIVVCIEKKFDNFFPPFFLPFRTKNPFNPRVSRGSVLSVTEAHKKHRTNRESPSYYGTCKLRPSGRARWTTRGAADQPRRTTRAARQTGPSSAAQGMICSR